eukprot:CAMPEP_0196579496 /NCGR_PEP_ID=MMETSP1081-20130531/22034_1 /TAXON_ID=36882 /ORGANISM="Pyramimonas amylifera, Strain CCMP720" /LENGTH=233 /DNA_ID=CAMNT_0041899113 /DNA_START=633 /DNA_END=1331 /DNA_ORIENTATION=-
MFYGCSRQTAIQNPVMSAKITSHPSFSFKYGRLEVRAKLPRGDWLWPAIWLLPKHDVYGGWPQSGEIDVMESRGNGEDYINQATGENLGVGSISSTLHWGLDYLQNKYDDTTEHKRKESGTYNDAFHIFGLCWDRNGLYTYVDTDENRTLKVNFTEETFWQKGKWHDGFHNPWESSPENAAPFDQEFYIVINLAIGGVSGYFPDGVGNKPWNDQSSTAAKDFWDGREQWYPTW